MKEEKRRKSADAHEVHSVMQSVTYVSFGPPNPRRTNENSTSEMEIVRQPSPNPLADNGQGDPTQRTGNAMNGEMIRAFIEQAANDAVKGVWWTSDITSGRVHKIILLAWKCHCAKNAHKPQRSRGQSLVCHFGSRRSHRTSALDCNSEHLWKTGP